MYHIEASLMASAPCNYLVTSPSSMVYTMGLPLVTDSATAQTVADYLNNPSAPRNDTVDALGITR
jgi:hypothetical protein